MICHMNAMSLGNEYPDLIQHVLTVGDESAPRGMKIKEVTPLVLEIQHPLQCIVNRPGFSRKLMNLEIDSVLSGTFDKALYDKVSSQASQMLSQQGAYGPRVRDQVPYVIEELERDPDSRRAVVYVGRETDLRYSQHYEQACTMTWQFLIRGRALRMQVNMRSWDLVWGLSYDVPVFVAVQDCLASALGVDLGTFIVTAGSGHIYERHFDLKPEPCFDTLPSFTAATDLGPLDEWRATVEAATRRLQALRA